MDISVQYLDLRLRTDEILTQASSYNDYEDWEADLNTIIAEWADLESKATEFEEMAEKYTKNKKIGLLNSFSLLSTAQAITTQEINDIFDKAPAGKKLKTLAGHLGVDAKRAALILQQAQNQVQADAWNEAGDTFQKLESSAVAVKDTCKVIGFVGGIALTGGTAGLAAAGTATKVAVAVSGADLVLEVTQDAATIALGNNNKVSEFVADARVVTEPAAAILAITTIPQNIGTGLDKFNAAMLALDQFNSAAQDGKVVGIALPTANGAPAAEKPKGAAMTEAEIDDWLAGLGLKRTDKNTFAVIEEVKERIEEVKQSQERIAEASSEQKEVEAEAKQPEEELVDPMSIIVEDGESAPEEVAQVSSSDGVKVAITSPEGTEFYKGQARMWKLDIQGYNPGPGASKVCHWTFYLNGEKYREMPDNKGCAFTSTFIEAKGSLRAEVRIDFLQGRSVFENGEFVEYVQDVVESLSISREYQVI
ncbi:hypothetical protein CVU83_01520 [Candidatus Falkowbacteria bacterium HGW-Falkowbacteria-2]|uniref:Uncharacterized protein n=1 Tax=Candidatus Falkowbacteria bacterium HGW-Falkowbacteria-2 TaxID=2013769 RepID=A0A2N2E1K6_9BACT|nr:MAG: hypothetical protein CVU83_01520 [Candidatus Falkowbacteria bacterium HGW-Falkowbacteria-2]